jgi:hypothetical protein
MSDAFREQGKQPRAASVEGDYRGMETSFTEVARVECGEARKRFRLADLDRGRACDFASTPLHLHWTSMVILTMACTQVNPTSYRTSR